MHCIIECIYQTIGNIYYLLWYDTIGITYIGNTCRITQVPIRFECNTHILKTHSDYHEDYGIMIL